MYEDIMRRRRGFGDIVVNSDEDVVVANSAASNDLVQDAFAGIRQLFEPVGGGPYPYVRTRDVGPTLFGDVVINDDSSAEGYDAQQDAFADDMLTSGDEGIGFAQARRLKSKLHRNRRRITETGYAVESDAPYQFGDLGRSLFSRIKKFKFGRFLGRTVLPVAAGGLALKFAAPKLIGLAKRTLRRRKGTVAVPTVPGTPAPAPTGAADTTGATIPPDIQAAMATNQSPSPIPAAAAAPTASEDVAAQAQASETDATEAGMAAGFTMPNFSDPKVLLTLGALGFLVVSQMGKGGSRRRSRRR